MCAVTHIHTSIVRVCVCERECEGKLMCSCRSVLTRREQYRRAEHPVPSALLCGGVISIRGPRQGSAAMEQATKSGGWICLGL